METWWGWALALAMSLTAGATASATEREVFRGRLDGAGDVVMELQVTAPGRYRGRYFYPGHGVDIPLAGSLDALAEPRPLAARDDAPPPWASQSDDADIRIDHPAAIWNGRIVDDRFRGQWRDADSGRRRTFDLRRVARYDPQALAPDASEAVTLAIVQGASSGVSSQADIAMASAPYEFLKFDGQPMRAGDEVVLGTVGYRMLVDPRTKFAYPRLTRHPDPRILAGTNRLLEQRHWHMSLEALACRATAYTFDGSAAGSLGSFDAESITVTFLSPALLSVVESGSTYCGGAHPNNHYEPYTLDLVRGGYLDFNRLLDAYVTGEHGYPSASAPLVAFIESARNHRAYRDPPQGNPGVALDDGDDLDCTTVWPQYLALHFAGPDRLIFAVSGVGHAMGVCLGPHMAVPFSDLRPLLRAGAADYLVPAVDPPAPVPVR